MTKEGKDLMKYIAYGSNMMKDQMAFRCPGARLAGTGHIRGARLEFYLHATVEKTGEETDRVPVAVWEISGADERNLDLYEGYPDYYIKEEWPVHMHDGFEIKGMIYIMNRIRPYSPTESYYNSIRDAYDRLGIGSEINRILEPALERSLHRRRFSLR